VVEAASDVPVMNVEMLDELRDLLFDTTTRYKVAYGGRGGSKSTGIADYVLSRMLADGSQVVVCRELKDSIFDSIHALLKERLDFYGVADRFEVLNDRIVCKHNRAMLSYKHLHNNTTEIKGLQGKQICWIFEAEKLTKESWDILDPTVRLNDSEVIIEFNPDGSDDFVYTRFVINTPDNCRVLYLTYLDNPWCTDVNRKQAEDCKRDFPDDYRHIWLGEPSNVGARIYPGFDEEIHVREFRMDALQPIANFFMGQDPATVYYPFCVWMARIARGDEGFDYLVYNEYPTVGMMRGKWFHEVRQELPCSLTLKQRANMYQVLDRTIDRSFDWIRMRARGIDTRFAKASGAASTTTATVGMIEAMADPANGGLTFETPPESSIDCQRDKLRELMEFNRDLGVIRGVNEPHFFVMPHCHNVIDAFKHHRVDRKTKSEDQKRKDPIDAVRICMATMDQHPHVDPVAAIINTGSRNVVAHDPERELRETFLNRR